MLVHSLNLNVFGAFMHKSVKHSLEYYELIKALSRKFTETFNLKKLLLFILVILS